MGRRNRIGARCRCRVDIENVARANWKCIGRASRRDSRVVREFRRFHIRRVRSILSRNQRRPSASGSGRFPLRIVGHDCTLAQTRWLGAG